MRFSLLLLAGVALALMTTGEANAEKEPVWSYDIGDIVRSVDLSADGEYIVANSNDKKVYLFHKESSTPLWNYTTEGTVLSIAISADGEYIVAGSQDNKIYFFSKDSSTPLWNYTTGSVVYSVDISADGEYIAAGSNDNKVYLFDKDSSTPLWNYTTGSVVFLVDISADGEYITAGSNDEVYLFDKDSSTPLWNYTTGDLVQSMAISADGEYIVAGTYYGDNKTYLFQKDSSAPLWSYETGGRVYSVAISVDGEYIVAGSLDNKVYVFDKDSSTPLWNYTTGNYVHSVAISADGEYIVAGSRDKKVYLFDKDSSTPLWSYETGDEMWSVAISADGEDIVACSGEDDPKVYLFDDNNPPTVSDISVSPNPADYSERIYFSANYSDSDGNVTAFEWSSDINGILSTSSSFDSDDLSVGNHTISFRVQDNDGDWSEWDTAELEIHPHTPPIANIGSVNYGQVPIEFFWTETHQNYTNQTHPWNATYSDPGDQWCSEPAWVFDTSNDGQKLWGPAFENCSGGGFGMYYAGGEGNLTTDSWDLSSYPSNTYLRIDHRYNWAIYIGYPTYSGGNVKVSTDNGENWSILKPVGGYPGTIYEPINESFGNPLRGQEAFVNFSGGQNHPEGLWVTDYFDLSTYTDLDNVKFKFHFGMYSYHWSGDYYHWHINSVSLVSGPLVPGFEFAGSGISSEYEIEEYEWYSSIDGFLSNQSHFSSFNLSDGKNHTIFFRVKDNYGSWSEYATVYLDRCPCYNNHLTAIDETQSIYPKYGGDSSQNSVQFRVILNNTGSHKDTYIPELESTLENGWSVTFWQDSGKTQSWSSSGVDIEAGELDDLWVFVEVADDADEGNYTIEISVRDEDDNPDARKDISLTVIVQRPELTILPDYIRLEIEGVIGNASTVEEGDTVIVLVDVENTGTADADDVRVKIFYYPKKTPTTQQEIDNLLIAGFEFDNSKNTYINVLYDKETNIKSNIKKSIASDDWIIQGGEWYVEARADYDEDDENGKILEPNENNNDARYPEVIQIKPDLSIDAMGVDSKYAGDNAQTPNIGDTVTFTVTVSNRGAADVRDARLYIVAVTSNENNDDGIMLRERSDLEYVEFDLDAGDTKDVRFRWKAVEGEWSAFRAMVNPVCDNVNIQDFTCESEGDGLAAETNRMFDESGRYDDNVYPTIGVFEQNGVEVRFEILPYDSNEGNASDGDGNDGDGNDGDGNDGDGGGIPPLSVILTIFAWVSVANIAIAVIALRLRPE